MHTCIICQTLVILSEHFNIDDILLHKPVSYSNIMMISPVGKII